MVPHEASVATRQVRKTRNLASVSGGSDHPVALSHSSGADRQKMRHPPLPMAFWRAATRR